MTQTNGNTGTLSCLIIFIQIHTSATTYFGVIHSKVSIRTLGECIISHRNNEISLTVVCTIYRTRLLDMVVMDTSINLWRNLITKSNFEHFTLVCIYCQTWNCRWSCYSGSC